MDRHHVEPAIRVCLSEIHTKLKEAVRIANAAEAYAAAGSVIEGVRVSMDLQQLVYEAGRLQDAASLLPSDRDLSSTEPTVAVLATRADAGFPLALLLDWLPALPEASFLLQ